jgi:lysozyme
MPRTKRPQTVSLIDFFVWYRQLPHQTAAIYELQDAIPAHLLRADADWYQTWKAGGKQEDMTPALNLCMEFEGLSLTAYMCPAGFVSIGYGTRWYEDGSEVRLKHKISEARAVELLEFEIHRIYEKLGVRIPYWDEMPCEMRCALTSFAYNCGVNFLGSPHFQTITAKLREKKWESVPAALVLYHNPGTDYAQGLKRRRMGESELWVSGLRDAENKLSE